MVPIRLISDKLTDADPSLDIPYTYCVLALFTPLTIRTASLFALTSSASSTPIVSVNAIANLAAVSIVFESFT